MARTLPLLLALIATPAPAATPAPLTPASKWTVNYAAGKCTAARAFGTDPAKSVTLVLDQFAPGDAVKLSFLGRRFATWSEREVQLRFAPHPAQRDYRYLLGSYGDTKALVGRGTMRVMPRPPQPEGAGNVALPPVTPAELGVVTTLELGRGTGVVLAVGRLDRLFAELNRCTDNLVRAWGFDPAAMAALQRRPVAVRASLPWLRDSDYPHGKVFYGQRGIIVARLNVDSAGAVTACEILEGAGGDQFSQVVCRALTKRARFEPALDATGRPTPAYVIQGVSFVTG